MTKLEQAARQALGALEVATTPLAKDRQEVLRAITTLREALSGVQALSAAPEAIAKLRHLYQNMVNGAVRDTASAKRIAEGLLAPAIEALERATPPAKQQAATKAAPQPSPTPQADNQPVPVDDLPTGAIINGRALAERLENGYNFECEAGPLRMCSDWQEFVRCFDYLVSWVESRAARAPADSVLEDAARLDWLLLHISGAEFRRIGVHYSGNASRADVDAARKQGGAT